MSRVLFHPDLIYSILEHLHNDTRILASLSLLNKESLSLATPLLYKKVHLSEFRLIGQFCDAIVQSERGLGIYPTSIRFNTENCWGDELLSPILELIKKTLLQTPNLIDLAIRFATSVLINLHQYLNLHPPSFSLHSLACHFTPDLVPFLSAQASIHNLTIYPHNRTVKHSGDVASPLPSSVLPRLESITGYPGTVIALLPGRPISQVDTIMLFEPSHTLYEGLRKSSAPKGIVSLAIGLPVTGFWTDILDLTAALVGICGSSLRELKVRMAVYPRGLMEMVGQI